MNDNEKKLLIRYMKKHYPDKYKSILTKYPLTGPDGLRRALGEKDPEYFCRAYLSEQFDREFGDYAKEILHVSKLRIESLAQEKQAIIAPREHGKSTLSSFAIPTWAAVYQKKKFIYFISANEDGSSNFLMKVQTALESPRIIEDFGVLKGTVWNKDEICLSTGIWIACSGWKAGIRGVNKNTRPDLIIMDDLEDKATMESESLRKKIESCFKEEIGRLGYYKTDFFYIGTLLAEDALLAKVMKDPSWRVLFYQCVKSFPEREDLWDQWRQIYRNIEDDDRFNNAYAFYQEHMEEMTKGAEVLWPGRFPDDELQYKGAYYNTMLVRETWGEDAFWKEDQNEPRKSGDKIFKSMSYWSEMPEDIELVMAIDPSEGKSDSSAFAIGGIYKTGYAIKEGTLLKVGPTGIIDYTVDAIKRNPLISEIIVEENLFRDMLQRELKKVLVKKGVYRPIRPIRNMKNKYARIVQLDPLVNNGNVLFNRANVSFNNEVMDYSSTTKHDDAPDVTQILIKRLQNRPKKVRVNSSSK